MMAKKEVLRKLKTVLFAAMFGAVVFAAVGCEKKVGVKKAGKSVKKVKNNHGFC
jgi:hypothetical protein